MPRIRSIHPSASEKRRDLPAWVRVEIARRHGLRPGEERLVSCSYCGRQGLMKFWPMRRLSRVGWAGLADGMEYDHVHPLARGGSSDPENIVVACRPCNRSKGSRVA